MGAGISLRSVLEAALKKKSVIIAATLLVLFGCGKPKEAHSYVFEGYTTTESGARAYLFESDELERNVHVHYVATCVGHVTQAGADGNCMAIARYLHTLLPPTYLTSPDGGQNSYLEIPSLNLEFTVEQVY